MNGTSDFRAHANVLREYMAEKRLMKAAPQLLEECKDSLAYFEAEWESLGNHPASRMRHEVEYRRELIAAIENKPPDA